MTDPAQREVLRAALAAAVERVIPPAGVIRSGDVDPDAVHHARVGVRRFRTILKGFGDRFEESWRRGLAIESKVFADALGQVRDADVMIARQRAHLDLLDAPERTAAAPIIVRLEDDRETERVKLLDAVHSPGHAHLIDAMTAAAGDPHFAPDIRGSLIGYGHEAWRRVRKAVKRAGEQPAADELHRIRILTKRARYVAEALVPVAGPDAVRFVERTTSLQDVLGAVQDAEVAARWLNAFASSAKNHAYAAGTLAGLERATRKDALDGWRDAWERLDRKKVTRWLT